MSQSMQEQLTPEDSVNDEVWSEADSEGSKSPSAIQTLILAYSSLGAIYGDIGTSPLYVLSSIKYDTDIPDAEDIYGAVSIIFYLFVILVLIKYAAIVLTFGPNNGEGGQVAIYAKIARNLHIGPKGVIIPGTTEKSDMELLKRSDTTTSSAFNSPTESSWKSNPTVLKTVSYLSLFGCFFGCSLVFSDGLLTPTTSVLSAVAGIQVAEPSFDHVLAVSEAVIIFLFLIQQFGSHKLSHCFAPIILVWLIALFICGVINITSHPAIFKSLSPHYAIKLLKKVGIDAFSGAMLAITGTEAMFADLGHFGKVPTQIGISFVFICLIITYLGQGAYLVNHPKNLSNVFYLSIPGPNGGWAYWLMFVLATLSTIIASQALILGVFSIVGQLINLDCFPKIRVTHFSSTHVGKVYIPAVNILLLIGVCATTAGYKNSNNVTAAYGLGISIDFLVTSVLMMIAFAFVYDFKWYYWIWFGLIFVPLECCLVISNLRKIPRGAWFPLALCAIFITFFIFWRYCREKTVNKQLSQRMKIADLYPDFKKTEVFDLRNGAETQQNSSMDIGEVQKAPFQREIDTKPESRFERVSTRYGIIKRGQIPGTCIIYSDTPQQDISSPNTVASVYGRIVRDFGSIPAVVIFCTTRVVSIPYVPEDDRILVGSSKIPGHYKCVVRYGFMEETVKDKKTIQQILIRFSKDGKVRQSALGETPVLHVFEKNVIRAKMYNSETQKTKNPFVLLSRYLRHVMINQIFSPLNEIFQYDDLQVSLGNDDEEKNKLFLGSTTFI